MRAKRCLLLALSSMTFGGAERLLSRMTTYLKHSGVKIIIVKFGSAHPAYGGNVQWFNGVANVICTLTELGPRPRWADLVVELIRSHGVTSVAISDSDDAYRMLPDTSCCLTELVDQ